MSYWDHRTPVHSARAIDVEATTHDLVGLLNAGWIPSADGQCGGCRAGRRTNKFVFSVEIDQGSF